LGFAGRAILHLGGAGAAQRGSEPVVVAGSYELVSTGGTFTGWTVVGAAGNIAIIGGTFERLGCTFPAAGGSQWLCAR